MKHKILISVMSLAIAFSIITGFSVASSAYGNVSDEPYSFYNINTSGNTSSREKEDATKTYIHPQSGPALTYTVQGYNGSWNNRSSSHTVYNGTQASFTNFVYENGEAYARLHFVRTTTAYEWTIGEWSPDSTQNYTIYY